MLLLLLQQRAQVSSCVGDFYSVQLVSSAVVCGVWVFLLGFELEFGAFCALLGSMGTACAPHLHFAELGFWGWRAHQSRIDC
jgi:hypothetical protein